MVQKADRKIEQTLKSYIEQLESIGIHVQQAILFGSYASGKYDEWSDIDLAIIMKDLTDQFQTQVKMLKLTWKFDTRVEPHPFDARDFDSSNPVANEILRTGIEISD